jgi:hypothetical protein
MGFINGRKRLAKTMAVIIAEECSPIKPQNAIVGARHAVPAANG